MHWIINDKIEFRPDSKMLISLDDPDINVVLTTPATRCFLLMLEAAPDLVTHQDFFKKVWEDEGMFVPANTLYQNISIIRRGLRAVDESSHLLISTVPRKGFQIDKNAKIINIVPDLVNDNNMDPSSSLDEHEGVITLKKESDENFCSLFLAHSTVEKSRGNLFPSLVMITFLIIGMLIGNMVFHVSDTKLFFDGYSFVGKIKGCNFYTNDENHEVRRYFEQSEKNIINSGLNCHKYPWVYFYSSVSSPGLIALVCRERYDDIPDPGCVTLSFRGVKIE